MSTRFEEIVGPSSYPGHVAVRDGYRLPNGREIGVHVRIEKEGYIPLTEEQLNAPREEME
jgi:hypothetical protein